MKHASVEKAALPAFDFSIVLRALQDAEIALHQQQLIGPGQHRNAQKLFRTLALTGRQLTAAIRAIAEQPEESSVVLQMIDAGGRLLDESVGRSGFGSFTTLMAIVRQAKSILAAMRDLTAPPPPAA